MRGIKQLFKDDNNQIQHISLLYTLHDTLPLEELPKAAKTLENDEQNIMLEVLKVSI